MLGLRPWALIGRTLTRLSSSSSSIPPLPESQQRVVVADGGRTVVCWHPEEPFPYEFTRPLPIQPKVEETSVLKDLDLKFKDCTEEEVRNRLMKITHTTKHVWFPKARIKKHRVRKPNREYL